MLVLTPQSHLKMADKQKILELDIDVESIISKSVYLKSTLDQLRETQDKLKKSGDTSSETYVKNAATIAKVSAEYNKNQQQLTNLTNVSGKYLTVQEKMTMAIDKEITSIDAARANNTELLKIRNALNLATEDGAKAAAAINQKLDENNKFIKENVSQYEQQKIGIGDYASGIREAIGDTGLFSGQLADMGKALTALSGPFKLLKDDFTETGARIKNAGKDTEGMAASQKALTIATNVGSGAMRIFALALAATGIGLIIAAVALLIGYLKTFTPIVDIVEQAMAGLGAVVKVVQQGIMSFVSGLNDLGGTLKKIASFMADPISGFREMGKAMGEAYNAAAKLQKAQQDLEDAMESQEIQSAKNRAEINRLNIQAKDRTKSEEERIALLKTAANIEEADFQQRKKNSDEQMRIALQQIKNEAKLTEAEFAELQKRGFAYKEYVEGKTNNTDELFDKLKEATLAQTDIENEFYTNQEKNINKQNKLIEDAEAAKEKARAAAEAAAKKAEEARQKILDDSAKASKSQLDLFISEQGIRAKSLQDEVYFAKQIRDQKLKIAQDEFNATKKTEADKLKLLIDQNNAKDEFNKAQRDATITNAQREVDAYIKANKTKLDDDKFTTELALQQEQNRLDLIAEKNAQFQALRRDQGVIDEIAYQDAITAIQEETRLKKEEAAKEQKIADDERKAIDLENQAAIEDALFQNTLDIQLQRLELKKQNEIKASDQTGASVKLINEKYAAAEKTLRKTTEDAKIAMVGDAIGMAKGLFKENTTAYKAAAIAEASIATYRNATSAYAAAFNPVPTVASPALGAVFAGVAIATGLANIAKIAGVKFRRGGRLKGPTHEEGGIKTPFGELEGDETVINGTSSKMFAPLLSAINVAGGGVSFAKGEIQYPSNVANPFNVTNQGPSIDYDLLAGKIAQANLSLPAPVVYTAIEDINYGQKNYAQVMEGANS